MHRGVDDGEIASTADRLADDGRDISLVHLRPTVTIGPSARPCSKGSSGISRSDAALTHSMIPCRREE